MANVVRARRSVSIRELARTAGALLNEIELEDAVFVVGKHGRMVALLSPLPERTIVEVIGSNRDKEKLDDAEIEVRPEWLELSPAERDAVAIAAAGRTGFVQPNSLIPKYDVRTVAIALGRLELKGLLERTFGGKKITVEGRAAAAWLARGLDRPEPAPPS